MRGRRILKVARERFPISPTSMVHGKPPPPPPHYYFCWVIISHQSSSAPPVIHHHSNSSSHWSNTFFSLGTIITTAWDERTSAREIAVPSADHERNSGVVGWQLTVDMNEKWKRPKRRILLRSPPVRSCWCVRLQVVGIIIIDERSSSIFILIQRVSKWG